MLLAEETAKHAKRTNKAAEVAIFKMAATELAKLKKELQVALQRQHDAEHDAEQADLDAKEFEQKLIDSLKENKILKKATDELEKKLGSVLHHDLDALDTLRREASVLKAARDAALSKNDTLEALIADLKKEIEALKKENKTLKTSQATSSSSSSRIVELESQIKTASITEKKLLDKLRIAETRADLGMLFPLI
jgi:hypothetical protein